MIIKCDICGYELKDRAAKTCLRCGNVLKLNGCENCKGCSLLKLCKNNIKEQLDAKI